METMCLQHLGMPSLRSVLVRHPAKHGVARGAYPEALLQCLEQFEYLRLDDWNSRQSARSGGRFTRRPVEPRSSLIESTDIAVSASENHTALQRCDDVVSPRNRIFTTHAVGKVLDAATEEQLHLSRHSRARAPASAPRIPQRHIRPSASSVCLTANR